MRKISLFAFFVVLLASCGQQSYQPSSLRLATYNLHHCASPKTGGVEYDGIAAVMKEMNADAVAIQELDSCTVRAAEYQVKVLAERSGMEGLFCQTIPFGGGKYGVGMLYRKGLELKRTDSIRIPGEEPRAALVAEFSGFVYICTHLCHKADSNRVNGIRLINDYVEKAYGGGNLPVFLAGDLNDTAADTPMGKELNASWASLGVGEPTFHGSSKPKRIDFILQYKFAGPQASSHTACIPSIPDPAGSGSVLDLRTLSDHYPVLTDIQLR